MGLLKWKVKFLGLCLLRFAVRLNTPCAAAGGAFLGEVERFEDSPRVFLVFVVMFGIADMCQLVGERVENFGAWDGHNFFNPGVSPFGQVGLLGVGGQDDNAAFEINISQNPHDSCMGWFERTNLGRQNQRRHFGLGLTEIREKPLKTRRKFDVDPYLLFVLFQCHFFILNDLLGLKLSIVKEPQL